MTKGKDAFIDTEVNGKDQGGGGTNKGTGAEDTGSMFGHDDIEIIDFEPPTLKDDDEDDGREESGDGNDPDTADTGDDGGEDNNDDTGEGGEEEDDDDANDKTGGDTSDSSSSSLYLAFAKVLHEGGVITRFDEKEFLELVKEKGEAEALVELNLATIDEIVQARFDSLPPDYKELLEGAEKGIPLRDLFTVKTQQKKYSDMSKTDFDTNESLAKDIMRESYKIRGFTSEEIEQEIADAVESNKLSIKAESSRRHLVQHNQNAEKVLRDAAVAREQAAEQRRTENLKAIKDAVGNIGKYIDGVTLSKAKTDHLYKMLTEPTKQVGSGWVNAVNAKRLEDPYKFDVILAYMVDSGVFDKDFSKFLKREKSNAIKDLKATIESSPSLIGGKNHQIAKTSRKELSKGLRSFQRKRD